MQKKITIYGSGLIGCGWGTHFLLNAEDTEIRFFDLNEGMLQKARERIEKDLFFLKNENIGNAEQALQRLSGAVFTVNAEEALSGADLIFENCPENLELKQKIAADIERYCPQDAIIASSTSGIFPTLIAKDMAHPERLVGAHPYHPVYLLPLVELVAGEKTDPRAVERLSAFLKESGKEPVVLKKECPGYIASRLMSVLFRESAHLIHSGVATMEDIDTAFTYGPGMRYGLVGINMTLQLAGGEHGLAGTLFGGIGTSGGNWMKSFANFTEWPEDYLPFWQTCQAQMDLEMAHRDELHGRTNAEIERFRDRGLIELLKQHGKI